MPKWLHGVSAYIWSDTELTWKSQAEGEGIPVSVTHQRQHAKDSPVERPQAKLSMFNIKLALTLQAEWRRVGNPWNEQGKHLMRNLKINELGPHKNGIFATAHFYV